MLPPIVPHVLLFGEANGRSREVCNLLRERGLSEDCVTIDLSPGRQALRSADLLICILDPENPETNADAIAKLLERARAEHLTAIVWGMPDNFDGPNDALVDCLPADVGLEEVVGRLTALARYAPIVKQMEQELDRLQRLGNHLNRYFDEIDQEMRLAGRLQRDFLPQTLPSVGPLRFYNLYRPAAWVSGDIFDVFPIDDLHLGMFIADAMGHGTAAGLMSMFLRRALVPTEGRGANVRITPPSEAMAQLHDGLARQNLPHAQFVTAAYAVINIPTLDVRLARGGHPYPLLVDGEGKLSEMRCEGGLLGVDGLESDFDEYRGHLNPGDKIIFYTDGLEELFIIGRNQHTEQADFTPRLLEWAKLGGEQFIASLGDHLDHREGSLNPEDDVTVVILEVMR